MIQLHQIIAAGRGAKAQAYTRLTLVYQTAAKGALFQGMSKTWEIHNEEHGEYRPDEVQRVQFTVPDILDSVRTELTTIIDHVATVDKTNQGARADVIVGDITLLQEVPAVTLLFLEKALNDLHSVIKNLPVLDAAKVWEPSNNLANIYETKEVESTGTKKVPMPIVLYEATDKHPAQVQMTNTDIKVGVWKTKYQSGAATATRARQLLDRVEALQVAVKSARQKANTAEVQKAEIGRTLLDYVLAP